MVTQIDPISTPPTPADTPADFEQKASQVWGDLFKAVPQMNQQALDIDAIGEDADAAKRSAQADSDAALGYRNEANAAKQLAQTAASGSASSAGEASAAKVAAQQARDDAEASAVQAAQHAASMAQAIAMAATFTAVPATFQAACIVVTQPHLRVMTWNGAKYIRAPWHPVGKVSFSYGTTLAGHLPIRADLSYSQADYPDLAAYLGLSGTGTFSLIEARGEFIRVLDNGRGKDVGRVIRSTQAGAVGPHNHSMNIQASDNTAGYGAFKLTANVEGTGNSGSVTGSNETRPDNIALPLQVTY